MEVQSRNFFSTTDDFFVLAVIRTKEPVMSMNESLFKNALLGSLTDLFGITGSVATLDVLLYESSNQTVVIRTQNRFAQHVWTSLTFLVSVQQKPCLIEVIKTSSSLISLACPSRDAIFHYDRSAQRGKDDLRDNLSFIAL
eukprot:TRINITY_DN5482_c0_g1_i4.p1 TRINITY_DN5482_c0_g1~~TRINITY_DN5482_c0_g1_i4.p1  ORF type:complete len:141 (+),score=19.55 TRINITY_DN5482_c0_g1_i4:160-582(+)